MSLGNDELGTPRKHHGRIGFNRRQSPGLVVPDAGITVGNVAGTISPDWEAGGAVSLGTVAGNIGAVAGSEAGLRISAEGAVVGCVGSSGAWWLLPPL
jgi:hypothetical protein